MDGPEQLTIKGYRPAVEDFVARLTVAGGEWERSPTNESARLLPFKLPHTGFRFLRRTRTPGWDAYLRIDPRGLGEWDVTVVPVGRPNQPFTDPEAHGLLAGFAAHAAEHARAAGLEVVGPWRRPIDLAEYTSGGAYYLAEQFLAGADHRDPLNRANRRLWREFVVRAFRDRELPPRDVVSAWLVQRGWPVAAAERLVDDYDDAVNVLTEYEEAGRA